MESENSKDEKKRRSYQNLIFFFGFFLIIINITQFFQVSALQNEILLYDEKIEQFSLLRVDLKKFDEDYFDLYANFRAEDFYVAAMVGVGNMTSQEGDVIVQSIFPKFYHMYSQFEQEYLINYYDPDYYWLFSNGIIWGRWLENSETEVINQLESEYNIDDVDNWYIIAEDSTEAGFLHSSSYFALDSYLEHKPYILIVDFESFDEYISINYKKPKIAAEAKLEQLATLEGASLIAILILGFIIDFDVVSKAWKKIYLFTAISSVIVAVVFTSLVFIGT